MPRLRIIAGPNGSGKSHLTRSLRAKYNINWGNYINADDIERALRDQGCIDFSDFGVVDGQSFLPFYATHVLRTKAPVSPVVSGRILSLQQPLPENTYFGTLCADYIRRQLMAEGKTFSFETVMSGSDKLRLLDQALEKGYRVYFYFVCTEDPLINIDRVADRVEKDGHFVPDALINRRYHRTLENLASILPKVRRAFLFDNSGAAPALVAEKSDNGQLVFNLADSPNWFRKYVLQRV